MLNNKRSRQDHALITWQSAECVKAMAAQQWQTKQKTAKQSYLEAEARYDIITHTCTATLNSSTRAGSRQPTSSQCWPEDMLCHYKQITSLFCVWIFKSIGKHQITIRVNLSRKAVMSTIKKIEKIDASPITWNMTNFISNNNKINGERFHSIAEGVCAPCQPPLTHRVAAWCPARAASLAAMLP